MSDESAKGANLAIMKRKGDNVEVPMKKSTTESKSVSSQKNLCLNSHRLKTTDGAELAMETIRKERATVDSEKLPVKVIKTKVNLQLMIQRN